MRSQKRRVTGIAHRAHVLAAVTVALLVVALLPSSAVVGQESHHGQTGTQHRKATGVASKEMEARQAAIDAYIYAYPLMTMEMTRRVTTNVAQPTATRAPMGDVIRMRAYPPADYHDVTAPNADTLYTAVWLDVSKEPWILSIPDMKDAITSFRCSTAGRMCSKTLESARPGPDLRSTRSLDPAGQVLFPTASSYTSHPQASSW